MTQDQRSGVCEITLGKLLKAENGYVGEQFDWRTGEVTRTPLPNDELMHGYVMAQARAFVDRIVEDRKNAVPAP